MMRGFTFIEVLVAMLIFVMVVLTAINMVQGSVRATRDAKEMSVGAWLLQNIMTETETKIETEGFEKACEKKKEGKFEPPYEKYTWTTYCGEIDFNLSQTAAKLAQTEDTKDADKSKEDIIQKLVLQIASDYISKSLRELHAEIYWLQAKTKRKVSATTHLVRFDQPLAIPPIALGGTQ